MVRNRSIARGRSRCCFGRNTVRRRSNVLDRTRRTADHCQDEYRHERPCAQRRPVEADGHLRPWPTTPIGGLPHGFLHRALRTRCQGGWPRTRMSAGAAMEPLPRVLIRSPQFASRWQLDTGRAGGAMNIDPTDARTLEGRASAGTSRPMPGALKPARPATGGCRAWRAPCIPLLTCRACSVS